MARIPKPSRTKRGTGAGAKLALGIDYYVAADGVAPDHGFIHGKDDYGPWELPFEGVGVFATSQGFALSRRTALYHVEGGASIALDDGVRLTASYRMLGMDFGYDSDVERADMEPGLAAPFVGLAIDF